MFKNGPFRAHQKIIMLHLGFLNCGILIFMNDWLMPIKLTNNDTCGTKLSQQFPSWYPSSEVEVVKLSFRNFMLGLYMFIYLFSFQVSTLFLA